MMITVNQTIIDELNEVLDDLGDNKSIPPSYKKYKRMDAIEEILEFYGWNGLHFSSEE